MSEYQIGFLAGCAAVLWWTVRARCSARLLPPNHIDGQVLPEPTDPRWQHFVLPILSREGGAGHPFPSRLYKLQLSNTEFLWVDDDSRRHAPEYRPIFFADDRAENRRYLGHRKDGPRLYAAIKQAEAARLLESHMLAAP